VAGSSEADSVCRECGEAAASWSCGDERDTERLLQLRLGGPVGVEQRLEGFGSEPVGPCQTLDDATAPSKGQLEGGGLLVVKI